MEEKRSYSGFALYDKVRTDIINELEEAYKIVEKINRKEASINSELSPLDGDVMRLKAKITSTLFFHLKDKINYPRYKEKFQCLKELNDYNAGKKRLRDLSLNQTREYLSIMRSLVEALGITRFEQEDTDPEDLVGELVE